MKRSPQPRFLRDRLNDKRNPQICFLKDRLNDKRNPQIRFLKDRFNDKRNPQPRFLKDRFNESEIPSPAFSRTVGYTCGKSLLKLVGCPHNYQEVRVPAQRKVDTVHKKCKLGMEIEAVMSCIKGQEDKRTRGQEDKRTRGQEDLYLRLRISSNQR
ncbi:hypothetical protein PoB_001586500 [Plakobranchus ocellatus]|uniref:Uncharacterized protein n=1 Tax=Plakobranchus ocellatus TaxID=259542 RepID=A0AAV3Z1U0_9GAST|nr:hypothetical protein PoB_001586500 [Plakobranchus ocellatus]